MRWTPCSCDSACCSIKQRRYGGCDIELEQRPAERLAPFPAISRGDPWKRQLIRALEDALKYEADMQNGMVLSFEAEDYLPAFRDACVGILEILRKDWLRPIDLDQARALMALAYEAEHNPGVYMVGTASYVDRWLAGQDAARFSGKRLPHGIEW